MARKPRAVIGGTFEAFHRGHRRFLRTALEGSSWLVIGITSDEYARSSKGHPVESYRVRAGNVRRFLEKIRCAERVEIVKIDDPYGPSIEDGRLEAIFVTPENASRGVEINGLREERGLPPLKVVGIKLVLADDGRPISATRIRKGAIDSEGRALRKARSKPRTSRRSSQS